MDRNWTICGHFRALPLLNEVDRQSGQFFKKVGFEPVLSINGLLQHILFRLCQMCLRLKSGQFLSKVDSFLPSVQVAGQAFSLHNIDSKVTSYTPFSRAEGVMYISSITT